MQTAPVLVTEIYSGTQGELEPPWMTELVAEQRPFGKIGQIDRDPVDGFPQAQSFEESRRYGQQAVGRA